MLVAESVAGESERLLITGGVHLSLKCRRVSCDPSGPRRPRRRLPHAATANLSGHSDRQMVGHDETLSLSSGRDI